jgi:hypothetical protein
MPDVSPIQLIIVLLFFGLPIWGLYWVIRKAVAAGMRDRDNVPK